MKPAAEAASVADIATPAADESRLPAMPSDDQAFFNESLRASAKSIGRLVQKRRKAQP
jgi:hypothetical protein